VTGDPDAEREQAYDTLARRDGALARLIDAHGRPDPFSWPLIDEIAGRDPFAELVVHVAGQQISTVAALAIHGRLRAAVAGAVTPEAVLGLTPDELRTIGMSGAKTRALHDLAARVLDGRLDFGRLEGSDDAAAQAELQAVTGIGPWTAQLFLLHHLRRPDVLPVADVALQRGAQSAFALRRRPTALELAGMAEAWRPLRSYVASLLWANARRPA
jgi:DNA-3-methyladenine glycosylase II